MKKIKSGNTLGGFYALLVSGIIYSTFGILIRKMSTSFETFTQVFLRCLVTTLIAFAGVIIWRVKPRLPRASLFIYLLFITAPVLSIASLTAGIQMIKAANAIFFIYVGYIATTLLLGIFFYKEKMTPIKYLAITCLILEAIS